MKKNQYVFHYWDVWVKRREIEKKEKLTNKYNK